MAMEPKKLTDREKKLIAQGLSKLLASAERGLTAAQKEENSIAIQGHKDLIREIRATQENLNG